MPSLRVVLVEPEYEENIGYCARLCANFSADLYLVNPKCNHLSPLSISRSMHGSHILKKAKIYSNLKKAIQKTTSIAFTARPQKPSFEILIPKLKGNISLVFGREPSGLTNTEISQCSLETHLPIPSSYKSLSLSHACSIALYLSSRKPLKPYSPKNISILLTTINKKISSKKTIKNKTFCKRTFQKLISSSFLSEKEINSLLTSLK